VFLPVPFFSFSRTSCLFLNFSCLFYFCCFRSLHNARRLGSLRSTTIQRRSVGIHTDDWGCSFLCRNLPCPWGAYVFLPHLSLPSFLPCSWSSCSSLTTVIQRRILQVLLMVFISLWFAWAQRAFVGTPEIQAAIRLQGEHHTQLVLTTVSPTFYVW
jgi:hypothetical protein